MPLFYGIQPRLFNVYAFGISCLYLNPYSHLKLKQCPEMKNGVSSAKIIVWLNCQTFSRQLYLLICYEFHLKRWLSGFPVFGRAIKGCKVSSLGSIFYARLHFSDITVSIYVLFTAGDCCIFQCKHCM